MNKRDESVREKLVERLAAVNVDGRNLAIEVAAGMVLVRGSVPSELPQVKELDREGGGPLPHIPRIRPGSPRLVLNTVRAPLRMHPWVAASAFVPQGRAQHRSLEALVRGMVERLAARLEQNPNDKEGWTRLGRAYDVLGETEKAEAARARADQIPSSQK